MPDCDTELGRLKRISLRDVWSTEASDFTPWLAQEDNIELLSDAIGMDLEVEAQEKSVGPFRADILCKDTANGHWVLIENQLEKTDHTHLGQLMTYAAGLNAVTIVWIADHFTDEHRAALDWLNDITSDEFNFFGLEVELWRIGNSPVAPKFNVVCKPNNWTRLISGATHRLNTDQLSNTKQLQLEYWTHMRSLMESRGGKVRPTKPQPQHWYSLSIGRSSFWLNAIANFRDRRIGVDVTIESSDAKTFFQMLARQRNEIEERLGESLEWLELPHRKQSRIGLVWENCDPATKAQWPEQHQWLYEKLESFHAIFGPRIKRLDVSEPISQ